MYIIDCELSLHDVNQTQYIHTTNERRCFMCVFLIFKNDFAILQNKKKTRKHE